MYCLRNACSLEILDGLVRSAPVSVELNTTTDTEKKNNNAYIPEYELYE